LLVGPSLPILQVLKAELPVSICLEYQYRLNILIANIFTGLA